MKVLYSWLRDFVDVPDGPAEVGRRLSLRGLALEGLEPAPEGVTPPGATPMTDDAVLDFDVTANRPDCLSVVGIAREIATVYDRPLRLPAADAASHLRTAALTPSDRAGVTVRLDAPDLCPRFAGAVASVQVAPSPAWLQRRLTAMGVRPISNVVDITNYVMLELGQPMHAFDHARLAAETIVVRQARPGETLVTLDGKTRTLAPPQLVVADAERVNAIGGVMGGLDSEVTTGTRRIVFEAAWWLPTSIRATSKALGLKTEASTRFERGADATLQATAMARACALLDLIGAGAPDGTIVDAVARPHEPRLVVLTHPGIEGLLGMPVPLDAVTRILAALGFAAESQDGGAAWRVTVPGWRPDVQRPEDLIEEVGRHHGFEHLPATFPPVFQAPPPSDPRIARDAAARRAMLALGYSETVSFAFVEAAAAAPFAGDEPVISLINPLSETFAVMRPSLLSGVIDAVGHNRRHGRRDVQVFEIATAFAATGERRTLAAAWTGEAGTDHWSGGRRAVDFFDLAGTIDQLARAFDTALALDTADAPYLVAGRAARVVRDGLTVGVCGLLAPAIAEARGLPRDEVYVVELDLDAASPAVDRRDATRVTALARVPGVTRDIAFKVESTLSAQSLRDTIRRADIPHLVHVAIFDRYDPKLGDGTISLALRLTFQADRTLVDDEIHEAMQKVAKAASAVGAVQR